MQNSQDVVRARGRAETIKATTQTANQIQAESCPRDVGGMQKVPTSELVRTQDCPKGCRGPSRSSGPLKGSCHLAKRWHLGQTSTRVPPMSPKPEEEPCLCSRVGSSLYEFGSWNGPTTRTQEPGKSTRRALDCTPRRWPARSRLKTTWKLSRECCRTLHADQSTNNNALIQKATWAQMATHMSSPRLELPSPYSESPRLLFCTRVLHDSHFRSLYSGLLYFFIVSLTGQVNIKNKSIVRQLWWKV